MIDQLSLFIMSELYHKLLGGRRYHMSKYVIIFKVIFRYFVNRIFMTPLFFRMQSDDMQGKDAY